MLIRLPEAKKKGVSYAQILAQAMQSVDLNDIGTAGVGFKVAATGARILEVLGYGCDNGVKADDNLAEKLRKSLGEGVVRVVRPFKCAELRVSGLDDSATSTGVAAAMARAGGCSVDQQHLGRRLRPRGGVDTLIRGSGA